MKAYLEPQEVARLEGAASCVRDRLLIRLLFRLGCRVSEALALRVEDFDFEGGAVTIQRLKERLRLSCPQCQAPLGRRHAFCPGCGQRVEAAVARAGERRRVRTLPLDRETREELQAFVGRNGLKGPLFDIRRGRAWQVVRDCARRAGLPPLVHPESGRPHGVSPHRLRDAFAVMAVKRDDSGDGLRLLQEHLGHTSFNTTARYRKVSGGEHREWYERLWEERRE